MVSVFYRFYLTGIRGLKFNISSEQISTRHYLEGIALIYTALLWDNGCKKSDIILPSKRDQTHAAWSLSLSPSCTHHSHRIYNLVSKSLCYNINLVCFIHNMTILTQNDIHISFLYTLMASVHKYSCHILNFCISTFYIYQSSFGPRNFCWKIINVSKKLHILNFNIL